MSKHPPIQIVDKDDNVIGAMPMKEAHKRGAIHRVARIMVENPKNKKILLQKRSQNMARWPNCWDNSAAGHVDEGEDYPVAAKRELSEEIGIKTNNLTEIGSYYNEVELGKDLILKRFNKVYRFFCEDTDFNVQKSEVSEVRWFTLEEIKNMIKDQPDKVTDGLNDVIGRYYS